jgi:hypothetical protein
MKKEVKEILDKLIDGKGLSKEQLVYLFRESNDITVEESQNLNYNDTFLNASKVIEYKRRHFLLHLRVQVQDNEVVNTIVKEIKYHES